MRSLPVEAVISPGIVLIGEQLFLGLKVRNHLQQSSFRHIFGHEAQMSQSTF